MVGVETVIQPAAVEGQLACLTVRGLKVPTHSTTRPVPGLSKQNIMAISVTCRCVAAHQVTVVVLLVVVVTRQVAT